MKASSIQTVISLVHLGRAETIMITNCPNAKGARNEKPNLFAPIVNDNGTVVENVRLVSIPLLILNFVENDVTNLFFFSFR